MNRVHSTTTKPLAEVGRIAVAIGVPITPEQRHIGILHREQEAGPLLMLHLRWHYLLSNDDPDQSFLWVDPAVHPKRLVQVAAICRQVWRANQRNGIPYGFSEPTDCFDAETCRFLLGPTRLGLTCASFVLAVFHRAGLPLVEYSSWPLNRPGDREWQESIINTLESQGANATHIHALRGEVGRGAVRYRPEEVAGAACEANLPIKFPLACKRAHHILRKLNPEMGLAHRLLGWLRSLVARLRAQS
jgi:hypothetical protein